MEAKTKWTKTNVKQANITSRAKEEVGATDDTYNTK